MLQAFSLPPSKPPCVSRPPCPCRTCTIERFAKDEECSPAKAAAVIGESDLKQMVSPHQTWNTVTTQLEREPSANKSPESSQAEIGDDWVLITRHRRQHFQQEANVGASLEAVVTKQCVAFTCLDIEVSANC